jgi:hypothetical protein
MSDQICTPKKHPKVVTRIPGPPGGQGANGIVQGVQHAGAALPGRQYINVLGAGVASVVDNPGNNSTDITLSGGGSSGGQYNVTLANGVNSNVATNGHQSVIYVGGPTAAFSIDGFDHAPAAGEVITVVNTTALIMSAGTTTGSTSGQRVSVLGGTAAPTQVRAGGFMQFTGNASPASGPTVWLLTHLGYARSTELSPLDPQAGGVPGAKGDGVTDDTASLQAAINAACQTGAKLKFPFGNFSTTKPLFTGGLPIEIEGAPGSFSVPGTNIAMTLAQIAPLLAVHGQFDQPLYGVTSGIYWCEIGLASTHIGGAQGFNLSYTPACNIVSWGGVLATTAANFTQPSVGGSVAIQVTPNTTALAAQFATGNGYMCIDGSLYIFTVVDSTHISATLYTIAAGYATTPGNTVFSGNIITAGGTGGGRLQGTGGFTYECFVDPVTSLANGEVRHIASSVGNALGSGVLFPFNSAFQLFLYNDQSGAQNRLEFQLTTTSGTVTLKSGSTTLPNGSMTHVAAVYDGGSTMSLYVNGVRAATASQTGSIYQVWYESFMIGPANYGVYPGYSLAEFGSTLHHSGGHRMTGIAMYSGASFTPPTTAPSLVSQLAGFALDFAPANIPNITGPSGNNIAQGYVIAASSAPLINANGVPMWIQTAAGNGVNYTSSPILRNIGFFNNGGGMAAFYWSALYGKSTNCVFGTSGQLGLVYDGFSYVNCVTDCFLSAAATQPTGLSAAAMVTYGSQFCVIRGGKIEGGAWNVINNAYAGFVLQGPIWLETSGRGAVLIGSDGTGPSFEGRGLFVGDDLGWQGLAPVASFLCYGVINVTISNGYSGQAVGGAQGAFPNYIFDSCQNVTLDEVTVQSGNGAPIMSMSNNGNPVRLSGTQFFAPFVVPFACTLTNGNTTVVIGSTGNIVPGSYITFPTAQPNTYYKIVSVTDSTHFVITPAYSGVTIGPGPAATVLGYPWMPESVAGQGALLINDHEYFGIHVVNMIASTGMTLWINNFLAARVIKITDANTLLAGTVQVTLPLIAGYQRTFINATAQLLTFGGATGSTISIAAGGHASGVCDGTNWIAA